MEEITPAILFYCRGEGWTNSADLIRFQAPLSSTNFSSNTIFCYGAFPLKIERDSKQKKQESCRLLFRFFRLCMCSRMRDIVWFLRVRACTRVTNVHTIRHTFKQGGEAKRLTGGEVAENDKQDCATFSFLFNWRVSTGRSPRGSLDHKDCVAVVS